MHPCNIKAILLLAGEGKRFLADTPKQFVRLAGKPIYRHTLDLFLSTHLFDEIILVCHPDHMIPPEPGVRVIAGGPTRQKSSHLGLLACGQTDIVVIHDGVRPFLTKEILESNIEAAKKYGAVDTCIPSADTIVHATSDTITSIPPREHYLRGQTPQTFSYPLILHAHNTTTKTVTDDCSLLDNVHIVPGSEDNIKITTELDLILAEQILRLRHTHPTPSKPISGTYFVIGGYGGIGTAICSQLTSHGATPIPLSRQTGFDITKDHLPQTPVDGLIIASGYLKTGNVRTLTTEEIDSHINVNLTGLIKACKNANINPGGHIVTIASSAYSRGRANYATYSAAKAGVVNFTQALADERPDIHVNCIVPGRTDTEMRRKNFLDTSSLLSPEDVANTIIEVLQSETTGGTLFPRAEVFCC